MERRFAPHADKQIVFGEIEKELLGHSLGITAIDDKRPWGGFFLIDEADSKKFIAEYFPQFSREDLDITGKLSPKILLVAPEKRLSWQYHHRRSEVWKLVCGAAWLMTSDDDEETEKTEIHPGDIIHIGQGKRHRLIGSTDDWGIIAEIWQHTDSENPSDENDIVRVQDDFGR